LLFEHYDYRTMYNLPSLADQIYFYLPFILQSSLGINVSQVKQLWLMPCQGPSLSGNQSPILTLYNAYIPSDRVGNLSVQIATNGSAFFNVEGSPGILAKSVAPNFPVVYIPDPYARSEYDSGQAQDLWNAFIAICGALGVIVLLALGSWWYVRLRRHRRGSSSSITVKNGGERDDSDFTSDLTNTAGPSN